MPAPDNPGRDGPGPDDPGRWLPYPDRTIVDTGLVNYLAGLVGTGQLPGDIEAIVAERARRLTAVEEAAARAAAGGELLTAADPDRITTPYAERAGAGESGPTLFGQPDTVADIDRMFAQAQARGHVLTGDAMSHYRRLDALAAADARLTALSGRWNIGREDPGSFVPGDVPALRYLAANPSIEYARRILTGPWDGQVEQALASDRALRLLSESAMVYAATPYFLPTSTATAIMDSSPMTEAELTSELRLPFDAVAVYFGADLEFDPAMLAWPSGLDDPDRASAYRALSIAAGLGDPGETVGDLTRAVRDLGGWLTGVVLFAGPGGLGLDDLVLWIVATPPPPEAVGTAALDRLRGIIHGARSASTLAPLVANLAAAVTWGAWTGPRPLPWPLPPAHKDAARLIRKTGTLRRAERRGALAGVHVLDLDRTLAPGRARAARDQGRPESERARPRPHPRRGHWRRSRAGPRDGWWYVRHWIPGRMVALDGARHAAGVSVYRLPLPPGAPPAARRAPGRDNPEEEREA
jgi:hypothetical protein